MARRRMIDPNFWDSEDVSRLSIMERLLLIGLFSNSDDFGKGRGNPTTIRSKIFPNDDLSLKDVEKALKNIQKNINVVFYEINSNRYYKFTKWSNWQRVDKPQISLIPEPPDSTNDSYNDSYNDSDSHNDSTNDSDNDYRLKERKLKEEKGKEIIFITAQNLSMNQDEYNKLVELYSKELVDDKIEYARNYKKLNQNYTSLYLTLNNWLKKDGKKPDKPKGTVILE